MTEHQLQTTLAEYLIYGKKHRFVTPNTTMMFSWECDLVSLTNTDFIHEYEIKRSKSDFNNDKKKVYKHHLLEGKHHNAKIPNYFWYVVHNFHIDLNEIPHYAGVITIDNNSVINIIKRAPRLSKRVVSEYQKKKLYEAVFFRYWRNRTNLLTEG